MVQMPMPRSSSGLFSAYCFHTYICQTITNFDHSQRFYKLKREADAFLAKSTDATGDSTTPKATPAKKGTATPVKKAAKTPAKASAKKRKTNSDDEPLEEDANATPSKKFKTKTDAKVEKLANGATPAEDAEERVKVCCSVSFSFNLTNMHQGVFSSMTLAYRQGVQWTDDVTWVAGTLMIMSHTA